MNMENRNNKYSVGGTILSGMIGAYVGYKYAESNKGKKRGRKSFGEGGGVGMYDAHKANIKYLESISEMEKMKILKNIANHYGISVNEAEEEVTYDYAEYLYEYIANDSSLRMKVYQEMNANKMARGGKFNQSWSQDHKRHNKSESYEVPVSKRKSKFAGGGKAKGIEWMKSDGQYEAELGDLYLIISPATERGLYQVRVKKGYRGETIGESQNEISGLDKAKDLAYDIAGDYYKQFGDGGGVHTMPDGKVMLNSAHYAGGGGVSRFKEGDRVTNIKGKNRGVGFIVKIENSGMALIDFVEEGKTEFMSLDDLKKSNQPKMEQGGGISGLNDLIRG